MPIVLLLVLLVPRLHCQKCGNISKDLQLQLRQGEDRIMMGSTASLHAVPWQAFILRWNRRTRGKTWLGLLEDITNMFKNRLEGTHNDQSLCGGSVIAKRFVLIARHCLDMERKFKADEIRKDSIHVYLGRHQRLSGGSKYGVSTISLHPNVDLALLQMDRDIVYSSSAWPVLGQN